MNPITGSGRLTPVILKLAAPVVLMMYLQNAYNIIDTIWVGRLLGSVSLAGIANGGYVLWGLFGLVQMVSVGLSALVARRIGSGQQAEAERLAAQGLRYGLVLSVFVCAAMWLALPYLFDIMGASGAIREGGLDYMRVLLLGGPLLFLSFVVFSLFQAAGDTVSPMWLMALSLAINGGLDPLFMLGGGPIPAMGLQGAALATVIARALMVGLGLWLLRRGLRLGVARRGLLFLPAVRPGFLRLCPQHDCGWSWSNLLQVLRIGLPHSLSVTLFPAVYLVLVRIPAEFGAEQVAALRIGHTVEGMSFFLAIGAATATATLVGQNLGAGQPERARRAAWLTAGMVSAVLFVFSIAFYFLADPIAGIFTPEPATRAAGAVYLRILAWSQVLMGLEIVLGGAFNGAGDTLPPMLINVPLNLARIPIAFALAYGLDWGVMGAWWAISGTSLIKGLLITVLFLRGRWARKAL